MSGELQLFAEPRVIEGSPQRAGAEGQQRRFFMKLSLLGAAVLGAIIMVPSVGFSKGCIKGAAVGAVAGHHAVAGAAAGCVIGHHNAKVKAKQAQQGAAPAPAPAAAPPATQAGS
jgi:hypothetical protein